MSNKQYSVELLKFVRGVTTSMLKNFPDDKVAFQPAPTDNHLLWILGHLAHTTDWFASLLDGKDAGGTPKTYGALFDSKSKPKADRKAYPPLSELRKEFERSFNRLVAAVEASSDADLAKPAPGDTGGFVSTRLDAVMKCVWHEGWHTGQLGSLRRALGLPPAMGG